MSTPSTQQTHLPSTAHKVPGSPDTTDPQPPLSDQIEPVPPPGDVIPVPADRQRTLVVCFDGTGDQIDESVSNVAWLFSMLQKDDRTRQLVYYQSGIGTYTGHDNTASNLQAKLSEAWDLAVAWNMDNHIMAGYTFLMENYIRGDRICLFGFSRGAYTARALAGMIHKVGLLPTGNNQQVPFAYNIYKRTDNHSWHTSDFFKKTLSIDVRIHFIGVWDTVRSVGIFDRVLPFSTTNRSIDYFRHAVSLDERRVKFKANHWNEPTGRDITRGEQYSHHADPDIREVWFAGVHCDVGGGSVNNDVPNSLAKISLRWMIKECFRCKVGILFKRQDMEHVTGLTPQLLTPTALRRTESKAFDAFTNSAITPYISVDKEHDIHAGIFDQLLVALGWWTLELAPLYEKPPGLPESSNILARLRDYLWTYRSINSGSGRRIPLDKHIYVHYTVHQKLGSKVKLTRSWWWPFWWKAEHQYTPKAKNWGNAVAQGIIWTD